MGCFVDGAAANFADILYCFMFSLTGGDSTIIGLIVLGLVLVISYQARLNGTLALLFGAVTVWSVYSMFGATSEPLLIVFGVLVLGIGAKVLNGLLDFSER